MLRVRVDESARSGQRIFTTTVQTMQMRAAAELWMMRLRVAAEPRMRAACAAVRMCASRAKNALALAALAYSAARALLAHIAVPTARCAAYEWLGPPAPEWQGPPENTWQGPVLALPETTLGPAAAVVWGLGGLIAAMSRR